MIRFAASEPLDTVWRIDDITQQAANREAMQGAQTPMGNDDRKALFNIATELERFCEKLELSEAKNRLVLFKSFLPNLEIPFYYPVVSRELDGVKYAITTELQKRTCLMLRPGSSPYFDNKPLFGDCVDAAFPSARSEIRSAGRSLALELYSASVFHLMRGVEIGLRALAKQLRVRKVKKNSPVELGTWEDVIRALEAKVSGSFPRTRKGQQDSDFYKGLFIEFRAFKDFWRNKVMHTRIEYDEHAAQSAFEHVQTFMQRLAERVSEN